MTAEAQRILLLGGDNPTTWIVYNELVAEFGQFPAIIEKSVSRRALIRNRAKKIGFSRVAGQILFATLVRPYLRWRDAKRIRYLSRLHGLEAVQPISDAIHHVENVNGQDCHALIEKFKPQIVIVNGTRILNRGTLAKLNATVINTHQGLTPGYRGAHGAYWALAQQDAAHCGVTVHLVDEGIDTGNIIAQGIIAPEAKDSFVTYPFLQTAKALDLITTAVRDVRAGTLDTSPISGASMVWYHPGIFEYFSHALRGVR